MVLTKDAILQTDDLPIRTIYIKEWKGEIKIKAMSARDRAQLLAGYSDDQRADLSLKIFIVSVVGEDDKPIFKDEHIPLLAKKNGNVIDRVVKECLSLNGIGEQDIDDAKKN